MEHSVQTHVSPEPSTRAKIVTRRTYNREQDGGTYENWSQTVDRVIDHQRWLWERAKGKKLVAREKSELNGLKLRLMKREASVSGRTLWLGGTDISKNREASQFNCSFLVVESVYDIVDSFWLLLQGCGVGFKMQDGVLSGFTKSAEIEVIRSTRKRKGGRDKNHVEEYVEDGKKIWHMTIGDSAESWAKSVGKIVAMKKAVDKIVLDFSQVRPSGQRLKGYGWVSSGDGAFSNAMVQICNILNAKVGLLLDKIDILDIMNWLGTALSSRRSAEIALIDANDDQWYQFATAKEDVNGAMWHRSQSNNTIVYWNKPDKDQLTLHFDLMLKSGGSEPGIANGVHAKKRAPWFKGFNPCAEILLGNRSFCNLVEIDVAKFNGRFEELCETVWIMGRANYRQTCVNLKDGVLSDSWHELNEYLRLCGVGITGIANWEGLRDPELVKKLRWFAKEACNSMADELGLPRPKLVTTIKPSGTLSKIMDTTEGAHRPIGMYIFNNINFGHSDPLIPKLKAAGYNMRPNPYEESLENPGWIVSFPTSYEKVEGFTEIEVDGQTVFVDDESAIDQLNRYKFLMDNWVDHNCSVTIYYEEHEMPKIVDWFDENWDSYVGVSFIKRMDPKKIARNPNAAAAELGYKYLPQEIVSREKYDAYVSTLAPVDIESDQGGDMIDEMCGNGGCPIR